MPNKQRPQIDHGNVNGHDDTSPGYTGRQIVVFADPLATGANISTLGLAVNAVATTSDFSAQSEAEPIQPDQARYFENLGVAVIDAELPTVSAMAVARADAPLIVPERFFYTPMAPADAQYLRGWQDATDALAGKLLEQSEREPVRPGRSQNTLLDDRFTWGLIVTGTHVSRLTGAGIKIAVLDTGFDSNHPDFAGRTVISRSFVPGQSADDLQGHGTHCIGTACGPRTRTGSNSYGCAPASDIHVGKVLDNAGRGLDEWILNGIDWALGEGCEIISMSLSAPYDASYPVLPQYERAGERALRQGALIVAAAGNDSDRPDVIRPVGSPASAGSIMAVAALDSSFGIARFSNAGQFPPAGAINMSGPGVGVDSSWPMPRRRRTISGTSMATPHVAGIAALYAESDHRLRGADLWKVMQSSARKVSASVADFGPGLVQAP